MAYKVVLLDTHRSSHVGTPGRPAKYHEQTKSVSFRVGLSLLAQGRAKFHSSGVNMTELFAYHYLHFVRQSIETTLSQLNFYRATYGPIENVEGQHVVNSRPAQVRGIAHR